MSDVMFFGVLQMPYEMAMADEMSRRQFYGRVQEALERLRRAEVDAERFRLAIESEDNSDTLHFAVINNAPDGAAIRAEFDAQI